MGGRSWTGLDTLMAPIFGWRKQATLLLRSFKDQKRFIVPNSDGLVFSAWALPLDL